MRLSRHASVLPGLALAALALTSCGGGGGGVAPGGAPAGLTAAQALAKVGESSDTLQSYAFDIQMDSTGTTAMSMTGHGSVQVDPLAMDMELTDMTVAGQSMSGVRMVLVDNVFYMKMPQLSAMIAPAEWVEMDLSKIDELGGFSFEELIDQTRQMDPMTQIRMLQASGDFHEVGTETVDGVETTHYSGSVDVSKLSDLAGMDEDLRRMVEKGYDTLGISTVNYEVWLDGDFFVRKMVMELPGSEGTQTMTMTLSDYNQPVDIEAPPASDTVDLLELTGQG